MLEKLKKFPTRVKNYVKEHPTECAWYAGLFTMGIVTLAVDKMLLDRRISQWDQADAITLQEFGPDATTFMTREGRFGAIWPEEIPDFNVE